MVHPSVARKMREYAIRQALSELSDNPTPKEMERIAKRHLLSYPELKGAYKYGKDKDTAQDRVRD